MRAAVVKEWSRIPEYGEFPDPQGHDDAVVADVQASALTNLTRGIASGTHYSSREYTPPFIPGVDGVAVLPDGRRVYTGALAPYGMLAEHTLINPRGAIELPEGIDSVTAAALPNPGVSAWMSLEHGAAVAPGGHVLVLGATGVTGSIAAQLAKDVFEAGRVVVAGRNTERLDWLRSVGADDVIVLGRDDLGEEVATMHREHPFDAVLDYLWGEAAETTLTALASAHPSAHYSATRFVQIGSMAGPSITFPAGIVRGNGITISGVGIGSVPLDVLARTRAEALPRMFDMVGAGRLQLITASRPLADIADVWAPSEPSGTRVVLTP